MKINRIVTPYLEANTFVLTKENHALIVDCGAKLEDIKKIVGNNIVDGILLTHGHFDHSRFCIDYAQYFSCKIYADKHITQTMLDKEAIYSEDGEIIDDYSNFVFIDGDKHFKIGNFEVDTYYCPGHSICSMCYMIENQLFGGDVLFDKSIGRTDLKFSNKKQMIDSLNKLDELDFSQLHSGHGEDSTLAMQKKNIAIYKRFLTR